MAVINSARIRRILTGKATQDISAVFDEAWYLEAYPDVAGVDPLAHFSSIGWTEERRPHPLFDTGWYLTNYPDVDASGLNPLVHYLATGWREGRLPNPLFQTEWYLACNPDVRADDMDPLTHYILAGAEEGRRPNPLFDPAHYASVCQDGQIGARGVLAHYLTEGWRQGLSPNALFDPDWYREKAGIPKTIEPLSHFLAAEDPQSPHPLFDAQWYLSQNEDVKRSEQNPLDHYLEAGRFEKSSPHPLFDAEWYLQTYPDVAGSGIDPFEHFLISGSSERRRPSAAFHTDWYAKQYPDAVASGMNLLEHFVRIGEKLGYKPSAFEAVEKGGSDRSKNVKQRPVVPKKPAADSGQVVVPPKDENGRLAFPAFTRGDGRRLKSVRQNRQHFWYDSDFLEAYLNELGPGPYLPGIRRLLVIGHDFSFSTGVSRPLGHYLNALTHRGGVELTSIEPVEGADASVIQHEIETHDFVIVNSITYFFKNPNAIDILSQYAAGKVALYLHETEFIFDRLQREYPEKYQAFADFLPNVDILTVSRNQEAVLSRRFGVEKTYCVYNTSPVEVTESVPSRTMISLSEPVTIVMAGTIQARKGVDLFGLVADLAKAEGLPWKFIWAGGEVGQSQGLYRSENVDFVGQLDAAQMSDLLRSADVFFLASQDDPFPLACLEALQFGKRVVAYRNTGTTEIVEGVSGCSVFEEYDADSAFDSLKTAVFSNLDVSTLLRKVDQFSPATFFDGMDRALITIADEGKLNAFPLWKSKLNVAVVLHLFYHDLWNEIAGNLENIRHLAADLYVTLTTDKSREELDRMTSCIKKRWPNAKVLEVPNQGMDVGPFIEVVKSIQERGAQYDVLLKVHSKKSLSVSGEAHGAEWRKALLGGLVPTQTDVDRILSIFEEHPEIGMVGVKGMRLGKSSKDLAAGKDVNGPNMALLADKMNLSDLSQDFFRGTMFWVRANDVIEPIIQSGLSCSDFEPGHQPDNSMAHAMERLFANMVRSRGGGLFEYDAETPKPATLLKSRHKGEDVYIIAAGATAGLIDPKFFEGKTVIGVNRVIVRFPCTYVVLKEFANGEFEAELALSGAVPITAKWDSGNIRQGKMRKNTHICRGGKYYFFEHLENGREVIDLSVVKPDSDKLVVSYSTITTAIHLAAYMGAANVVIVGHDCGLLDGKAVFDGYYKDMAVSPWTDMSEYSAWLQKIESQTIVVRDKVVDQFEVAVLSLNPFVNIGLEGHSYSR